MIKSGIAKGTQLGNTTLLTRLAVTLGSIKTTVVGVALAFCHSLKIRQTCAGLAVAALIMTLASPAANAIESRFGPLDIFFDTTISTGVSVRIAKRNEKYLPAPSGGPLDTRPILGQQADGTTITDGGTFFDPSDQARTVGSITIPNPAYPDNFDGASASDDSRLNFDQWDLTSATTKMTNDIQIGWGNHTFFSRLTSYYDAVLNQDSSYERSGITDSAKTQVAQNVDFLDLYVSGDYDIGSLPVNIRLGNQVISWGEGTFLFNGINSINPIDVSAFRRPGAEIKEGLLPILAAYTSIGLPFDLTLDAFYQFGHEEYELDRDGTPFSAIDVANRSATYGGNINGIFWYQSGGWEGEGLRRSCRINADSNAECGAVATMTQALWTKDIGEAWATGSGVRTQADVDGLFAWNRRIDEDENLVRNAIGRQESIKYDRGTLDTIYRAADLEPSDDGQYGLAFRWYSEALNYTEFGFYHINYHSRLPLISLRRLAPIVYVNPIDPSDLAFNRQVINTGCLGLQPVPAALSNQATGSGYSTATASAGLAAAIAANPAAAAFLPGFLDPRLGKDIAPGPLGMMPTGGIHGGTGPNTNNLPILDPNNYIEELDGVADQIVAQIRVTSTLLAAAPGANTPGDPANIASLGFNAVYARYLDTTLTPANHFEKMPNTFRKMLAMNCVISAAQSAAPDLNNLGFMPEQVGGISNALPNLVNGAEFLTTAFQSELFFEYPEDISLWGMSFNTTFGAWGVQGEVSYRENQPLQLDPGSGIAGIATMSCSLNVVGDLGFAALEPLSLNPVSCLGYDSATNTITDPDALTRPQYLKGYIREEIWTGQIGTTAAWSASEPFVNAVGADNFIFLTEVGGIYAPDIPRPLHIHVTDPLLLPAAVAAAGPQIASTCTSGSDIPLGGIFGADVRHDCRPDTFSWGYVLVGIWQYANALGTAWTVSPSIAWSHDVKGYSPAPFSQYTAGSKFLDLRMTAEYQGSWRVVLGYTDFLGKELRDVNLDRDFMALDISYAF
ncbi:MAG: DUF1302 family protein [Parvularculales bacterium]